MLVQADDVMIATSASPIPSNEDSVIVYTGIVMLTNSTLLLQRGQHVVMC